MGWYRLYFLGQQGDIRNVDEFNTDSDDKALIIADGLQEAVSDVYVGYELWRDSQRIFRCSNSGSPRPFIPDQTITRDMQVSLLRREEVLQSSETAFARSQRLLERIRDVRDIVGAPDKRAFANKRRANAAKTSSP